MEKYIEDARQREKDVPDLLESIMRRTCLVKEELRPNLMKMNQFRPKIRKIRGFNFLDSGNLTDSRRRPMPAFSPVGFELKLTLPGPINPQ